ncbi:hypothetical protein BpHYR1_047009 [Brachionus plicatilis]|uniref:Uncharacterized protein n=1 Tax=Brachionus plicatilis TaxID=10195 RepID=A0A3M7T8A0_BRAPC|nr:hypothetical protein BpHYR1_047009 [Brachionus plicatilis]
MNPLLTALQLDWSKTTFLRQFVKKDSIQEKVYRFTYIFKFNRKADLSNQKITTTFLCNSALHYLFTRQQNVVGKGYLGTKMKFVIILRIKANFCAYSYK